MAELSSEAFTTALLQAFDAHRADDVRALLLAHPELTRTSIHAAAAMGESAAVRTLLAADPSCATRCLGPQQIPPIALAANGRVQDLLQVSEEERTRTVQLLLDAGASPNTSLPSDGPEHLPVPVLYLACVTNNVAAARTLLAAGAEPNDGESVYHAAEHNHRDCLELLLAHGADLSARHPHWDNTPLYFLAGFPPGHPTADVVARGMAWLLEHGADPNEPSLVRLQRDGRPGLREVPLHRLAGAGVSADTLERFLAHGAAVDAQRSDGVTPLGLAVRMGHQTAVAVLEAHGADPSRVRTLDHLLALAWRGDMDAALAYRNAHPEILDAIRQPMADDVHGMLLRACQQDRGAAVSVLLALGWSLTQQAPWGGTALHWAAWHGRPHVVAQLLTAGAPLNTRDSQYGSSAIAWAAHGSAFSGRGAPAEYRAVVRALIAAGATRPESFNRWQEAPETLAHPDVAEVFTSWDYSGETL